MRVATQLDFQHAVSNCPWRRLQPCLIARLTTPDCSAFLWGKRLISPQILPAISPAKFSWKKRRAANSDAHEHEQRDLIFSSICNTGLEVIICLDALTIGATFPVCIIMSQTALQPERFVHKSAVWECTTSIGGEWFYFQRHCL